MSLQTGRCADLRVTHNAFFSSIVHLLKIEEERIRKV